MVRLSSASLFALAFLTGLATAVEPSIRALNIRGLQIGGTTEITIDGDDLTAEPKLLLPFAAEQEWKAGGTEKKATVGVKLGDDIEPGYYQLRVTTFGGVSLPLVIGVDRLAHVPVAPRVETLPVAAYGSVSGSSIVETKFTGKKDQPVTIEIEAQRLGSKLRPVIHLYDAAGKQLAWSWSQPSLFGDARFDAVLPADGEYRVTCHDLEYAAPSPSFFRLKIGQWTRVEQVVPSAMRAGDAASIFRIRTQTVEMPRSAQPGSGDYAFLPTIADLSGPRPFVRVTERTEHVENVSYAETATPLGDAPFSMHGELREPGSLPGVPGEEDRYLLAVKPGEKLRCEVFAERNGATIDARLVVRNEQDAVIAQGEDSPGTLDPALDLTVPEKVNAIRVCVTDARGTVGPRAAYQLVVHKTKDAAGIGDFKLRTTLQQAAIPKGGRWVVPVTLDRRGYTGPIELSANQLPTGLSLAGTSIAAGNDGALVTITADDSEPAQLAAITAWQGKTGEGKLRAVSVKNHPLESLQPWLAEEIAIARVNTPAADFAVEWRDLPDSAALQPTAKLALPIKLTRVDDKTAVRLSLLTSQLAPLANNQPDPNKTLRVERAVELGAKQNDGELTVLVPAELPSESYDIAVQAELLSADKQKVLATAFTPVRKLPVQLPVELQLAGGPKFDVTLDPAKGATQKIEGTIKRREGITGDVVIALAGLPSGVRADSPTVKAEDSNFSLTITLPANQTAGELSGLKLTAAIAPDSKQANVRVKSREVDLVLNVTRPD